jgi:hypothetical protein
MDPPRPPFDVAAMTRPSLAVDVMLGFPDSIHKMLATGDADAVVAAALFRPDVLTRDVRLTERALAVLVENGHFEAATRAGRGRVLTPRHARALIRAGRLDAIQWAWAQGAWPLKLNDTAVNAAAARHLCIVEWVHAQGGSLEYVPQAAAYKGYLEIVQWAAAQSIDVTSAVCVSAATAGHLHILQWAHAQGMDVTEAPLHAAMLGQMEVVQWAHAHGLVTEACFHAASMTGQLEVLEWGHARGLVPATLVDDTRRWLAETTVVHMNTLWGQ